LEKDDAKAFIGNLNTLAAKHAGGDAILKVAFFETSLLAIAFGEQETYCDGWSKGYSTGFCYGNKDCDIQEKSIPTCAFPTVSEYSYKHGYDGGMKEGLNARP
jgi:hypothetical protein